MLPHMRMSQISRRANYIYYQLITKAHTTPEEDNLIEILRPRNFSGEPKSAKQPNEDSNSQTRQQSANAK